MEREKLIRNPQEFKEECKLSAFMISQNTDLPISILLSGGLDSICVCESFRREEIPFTAYTYRFINGYNDYDIKNSISYCKKYDIDQKIIEIDLFDFWGSDLFYDYIKEAETNSPQFAVHCWMIDKVPGFIVMGNGEVDLIKEDNDLYYNFSEHQFYDERFLKKRNREGVVKFYNYTSEQEFSKYTHNSIFEWLSMKENVTTEKCISHNKFYVDTFGIEKRTPRQMGRFYRSRFTGFEEVSKEDNEIRNKLKNDFPEYDYKWGTIPYLEFLENFYGNEPWHNTLRKQVEKKYNDQKNNI